jgi:hypothetical protein
VSEIYISLNEEGVKKQLSIAYKLDSCLMFLIQDVSKKPSADIINFFYELATTVCELSFKNKRATQRGFHKNIIDYFPGTSIPFNLKVSGYTRSWDPHAPFHARVEVKFPEKARICARKTFKR